MDDNPYYLLLRFKSDRDGTFGTLLDTNANKLCYTCEEPWRNNATDISCIPAGTYECQTYSSPKFPDVWQVMNVPGRGSILIHNGNTITDTHGCILVGDSLGNVNGMPAVLNSVATLHNLKQKLPVSFQLKIRDASMPGASQ